MKITTNYNINGLVSYEPAVHYDERGQYFETYNENEYNQIKQIKFVVDDISISKKNVFRGLHGDWKTYKLIQCLYGQIILFVVDLRKDSTTFKNFNFFHLNDENKMQILIPPGCANGHYVLSEKCIFSYKQSEYYSGSNHQFTLKYDFDDMIKILVENPILSERDKNGKTIGEIIEN